MEICELLFWFKNPGCPGLILNIVFNEVFRSQEQTITILTTKPTPGLTTAPPTPSTKPAGLCTCGLKKPIGGSAPQFTSTTTPATTLKPNSKILGGKVSSWHPWVALLYGPMGGCTGIFILNMILILIFMWIFNIQLSPPLLIH